MNTDDNFYVPHGDYIAENRSLWSVGCDLFTVHELSPTHYYIGYTDSCTDYHDLACHLEVRGTKLIINGKGSRLFRNRVINAYNWYKKAKDDSRYIELFIQER